MLAKDWPQFRIRVPERLRQKLKEDAAKNYRTLNSEIVMILESHFEAKEKAPEHGLGNRSDASDSE